jgi:hypothetical protein
VTSEAPLPPPVPVSSAAEQPVQNDQGLFGLRAILGGKSSSQNADASAAPSPISSVSERVSEPEPGEPLDPDAERLLKDLPRAVGAEINGVPANDEETAAALGAVAALDPAFLQSLISFDEEDVRGVLEEGFDFLAERFDSAHWKLTERQSRMLGRPTAQLLTSVWMKLSYMLPAGLAEWCSKTPGLAAFVLTSSIVIGPKVAQQLAVSRQRSAAPKQVLRNGPVPVVPRGATGPVGPIDTSGAQPIPTDHSFE